MDLASLKTIFNKNQWHKHSFVQKNKHILKYAKERERIYLPYTYTHTHLTALFRDYPGEPVPERQNQSGFYWSKKQWVAVASAGTYASLHLASDR